jgi:hypothetical protein
MKKVFNSKSDIAHIWANQSQSEARLSGANNFYFYRDTIYSYGRHFPIAKHVVNDKGERAVLFTLRSYSNTTAKHILTVSAACRNLNRVYCYHPEYTHNDNFDYWERQIVATAQNLKRAKKPEIYLSQISHSFQQAKKYAEFWGIEIPESLQIAASIQNKAQFAEFEAKREQYEMEQKAKQEREAKKAHTKSLTNWRNGETSRLYSHNGQDYLRLNDGHVETSQSVKIPIGEAKKMYQSLNGGKVGEIRTNTGTYQFNFDGKILRAGCHTIAKKEIENLAKLAGWQ